HSLNARYQQAMAARGLAVSCCSGEAAFLSGPIFFLLAVRHEPTREDIDALHE
ncbi:hypothetical protein AB8R55_15315, partial [Klebsiella pneumoniae subsp. ozaenae]